MSLKPMAARFGAVGAALLLTACASTAPGPSSPSALPAMTAGAMTPVGGAGWQWGTAEEIMASQMPDPMLTGASPEAPKEKPREKPAAVTLLTNNVTLGASALPEPHSASVTLTCFESGPSLGAAWDAPVGVPGQAAFTYGFNGQQPHTVAAAPVSNKSQVVIDPVAVARFLDEASTSNQLVIRVPSPAGGLAEARFDAGDPQGSLRRFRAVCPTGTN
jgi:hypothetical protein